MLTPNEILEYAIKIEQTGDVLNEALLLEAIKPEDALKISEANDKLLGTLEKLNKAFAGKVKSITDELESLIAGAKTAAEALKEMSSSDGLKSEKFLAKIKAFFDGDSDPKAFLNSVLLLQSRAQELVEILKYSLPKIIKTIDGVQKSADSGEVDAPNAKTGLVNDVLGTTPEMGAKSIYDLLVKARPGIFKKIGNFFKGLNVSRKIINVNKKIDYKAISEEMAIMPVKDLRDISKGTASIETDTGGELEGIIKKASDDLKPEGEGEASSEETKEAEVKSDPTKALNTAKSDVASKTVSPKKGIETALKGWYDGLAKSAQQTITQANRMGDLRDLVNLALDDSAKAVEGQVAAAVQTWRDQHEKALIKSKRFAKKNFESLKTLIPQIVSAILKKKEESARGLTREDVNRFVFSTLDRMFFRDPNTIVELMGKKSTSRMREIVELTKVLREMAESDVRDASGNVLIQPGLKVKHKKSGLEYSVQDVIDDEGKVKIVLNVPEVPRVQPAKTPAAVVTEKDTPGVKAKSERLAGILDTLDKEEQTVFVVDEKEFEKKYEVR